jgi:hypothetical protein
MDVHTGFREKNLKEEDHYEDLDTDGRIILQEVLVRTNRLLSFDTTWTEWKMTPPTNLRCSGDVFTEP